MREVERDCDVAAESASKLRDLDCDRDCLIASSVCPASVAAWAARTWFMMLLVWSCF